MPVRSLTSPKNVAHPPHFLSCLVFFMQIAWQQEVGRFRGKKGHGGRATGAECVKGLAKSVRPFFVAVQPRDDLHSAGLRWEVQQIYYASTATCSRSKSRGGTLKCNSGILKKKRKMFPKNRVSLYTQFSFRCTVVSQISDARFCVPNNQSGMGTG